MMLLIEERKSRKKEQKGEKHEDKLRKIDEDNYIMQDTTGSIY